MERVERVLDKSHTFGHIGMRAPASLFAFAICLFIAWIGLLVFLCDVNLIIGCTCFSSQGELETVASSRSTIGCNLCEQPVCDVGDGETESPLSRTCQLDSSDPGALVPM